MPTYRYAHPHAFSRAECLRLIDFFDNAPDVRDGRLAGGKRRAELRECQVLWVEEGPLSDWVFARIAALVSRANQDSFDFDLEDFREGFQIIRYGAPDALSPHRGHYDWHIDIGGAGTSASRKLSLSVQLSRGVDYTGGGLVINGDGDPIAATRRQGAAVLFPSFTPHKVRPVRTGTRYALVAWVHGPAFK